VRLPFQYGRDVFEATLRFAPGGAWRAERLADGRGTLTSAEDGSVAWRIDAASEIRLLCWVIENGPGIDVVAPPALREALAGGLAKVVTAHGE
jgi:predicted DNA-binding transcriptional regulator YafY